VADGRSEYPGGPLPSDGSLGQRFRGRWQITASFYPGDTASPRRSPRARKVALQRDGKIQVVGSASNGTDGHGKDMAIAPTTPTCTLDQTFGHGGVAHP